MMYMFKECTYITVGTDADRRNTVINMLESLGYTIRADSSCSVFTDMGCFYIYDGNKFAAIHYKDVKLYPNSHYKDVTEEFFSSISLTNSPQIFN